MTISDEKQKNKVEVYVDTERCKGCGLCITFCPQGALSYDQHVNTQGYNPAQFSTEKGCNGCKRCQIMCPDLAITIVRKKDKG
jgi:2-oxoglutarate ferredoxin oxidoreductase subunit delta